MRIDDLFDNYEDLSDMEDEDLFDLNRIESTSKGVVVDSRHIMDGATSLSEAADMLRLYADHLDALDAEGFQLYETIAGGSGYAIPQVL